MKEVIEYILAFLVILSVLPIYNYIMTNLYTPPQLEVEEPVLATFSDRVVSLLEEQAIYGNLTSPLIDIKTLIENKFPYITKDYMFNIKIISAGIQKTIVNGYSLYVYTLYKGNVTAFIVYKDYTLDTVSETQPTLTLENGTYVYQLPLHNIPIFIMSVLDTGTYRFIDYYYDQNTKKVYIGNYNGKFAIITDQNLAYYSLPEGKQGVKLIIVTYSNGKFHIQSKEVVFGDVIDTSDYYVSIVDINLISIFPFEGDATLEFKYTVDYDNKHIRYFAIDYNTVSINGAIYKILCGTVLSSESIDTIEYMYYIYVHVSAPPLTIDEKIIGKSAKLINQRYIGASYSFINAPIYNLPMSIIKDANGNEYIGIWYPHELTIGYTPPSNMPTRSITLIRRLGSVDYYITITLWRRTT